MASESKEVSVGKWIPLESNPEVMNSWSSKLGLSTKVSKFEDVYGLDPELLALVPQPSKAFLLIFPLNERLEESRKAEDQKISTEGQHKLDPSIIFIKQTISNACGTIGLLHALANSDVTIDPTSPLAKFFTEVMPLSPELRAKTLQETHLFADAHVTAASLGQSAVPSVNDDVDLHFIVFIQAMSSEEPGQKRLVELDGRRPAPVDHGKSEDFLQDVANLVRAKYIALSTSQNFGLISLGPPS